ncbi:uncharacterized protein [Amphiura filiformis]|uniref:uncharacterized protein n=1 Tax=Amphiura filiformis TaxID=82378 RepID=UPI003B224943
MYGAETWTIKKEDENRLLVFEMMCLRKIMGVSRLDRIRNTIIRDTLGLNNTIIDKITQKRIRFFGHIQRMRNDRYPKIVIEGNVHGKRPRGRPPKRWMDTIKTDCLAITSIAAAGRMAKDRVVWHGFTMDQMARQSAPASVPTP